MLAKCLVAYRIVVIEQKQCASDASAPFTIQPTLEFQSAESWRHHAHLFVLCKANMHEGACRIS